ncbi:MAG TPA: FAD-dependent oxidoreductase, partial [Quisquiliibacterium sp.]|nr:FAD-dependent oxidoreductase [Quisquiliibacterium sp.]
EPLPPYQRPPLSKAWLKGEVGSDDLLLRPAAFYADKQIDLRVSARVTSIDPQARSVMLADGTAIGYDALILATGSRLRKLAVPGADLPGVLELRTAADGDRIRAALRPGARLAVVGGGYVGLEVAASARALGAEVVVLEREPRLLARVASVELSTYFAQLHRAHGVQVELGADLAAFEARDGRVAGALLRDGRRFECDVAVVGIGALANDTLASAAGLACQDGIVVDENARTSHDRIHAVGDCTRRPVPRYGRALRLESVPNALEQAKQAAAYLCGKPVPKAEVPWFWSDQYDVRLQIVGMAFDVARTVVRGDVAAGRFAVFHLAADGALQAVEAVNSPPEFVAGKMLVAAGKVIDPARLADASISMKELAA